MYHSSQRLEHVFAESWGACYIIWNCAGPKLPKRSRSKCCSYKVTLEFWRKEHWKNNTPWNSDNHGYSTGAGWHKEGYSVEWSHSRSLEKWTCLVYGILHSRWLKQTEIFFLNVYVYCQRRGSMSWHRCSNLLAFTTGFTMYQNLIKCSAYYKWLAAAEHPVNLQYSLFIFYMLIFLVLSSFTLAAWGTSSIFCRLIGVGVARPVYPSRACVPSRRRKIKVYMPLEQRWLDILYTLFLLNDLDLKCDETTPTCAKCARASLECSAPLRR